jgi:hypothetical protein
MIGFLGSRLPPECFWLFDVKGYRCSKGSFRAELAYICIFCLRKLISAELDFWIFPP